MITKAKKIFLSDFGDAILLNSSKINESVSRMFRAFASKVVAGTEDLPFFVSKGYVFPSVKYCVKACKGQYSAVVAVSDQSFLFNLSASNETDALRQARSVVAEVFSGHVVAAFNFSDGSSASAVSFGSGEPIYSEIILDGAFNSKAGVWTKIAQGMTTPNRTKFIEKTLVHFDKKGQSVIAVRSHKNLKAFKAIASSMERVVTHLNNAIQGEGTVGIFTSIQSMGKGSTIDSVKNEKNYAKLGKILNTLLNGPIPMKGLWHGEAEDSYLVPDIPLDMLKALNSRYKQWAFIYAGPDTDGKFQFWATSDPTAGPQSYEMVSAWDNYAVEGLKEPEGYTALPGTEHKFSFYEGGDTPQEYINAVDELNNWANTAIDSVKVEFSDADREDRVSEKNDKLKEQVAASKKVKAGAITINNMLDGYKEAIIWTEEGAWEDRLGGIDILPAESLSDVTVKEAKDVVKRFYLENEDAIDQLMKEANLSSVEIGNFLWMSRQLQATGFSDYPSDVAEELHSKAKDLGRVNVTLDDRNKIHTDSSEVRVSKKVKAAKGSYGDKMYKPVIFYVFGKHGLNFLTTEGPMNVDQLGEALLLLVPKYPDDSALGQAILDFAGDDKCDPVLPVEEVGRRARLYARSFLPGWKAEASFEERREDVGKYNTVEKVVNAIGRWPSELELAKFIDDNYYDVTEVERGQDDERGDDKIADLVSYFKYDIDDWLAAWEGVTKKVEASNEVKGSYSARSFPLTEKEYNFLLPVLPSKLSHSSDNYYFIGGGDDVSDMLSRLSGLYDYFEPLNPAVSYKVFKSGCLKPFRDFLKKEGLLVEASKVEASSGVMTREEAEAEVKTFFNDLTQDVKPSDLEINKAAEAVHDRNLSKFSSSTNFSVDYFDEIVEEYLKNNKVTASGNKEHHLWYMYIKGDIDLDSLIEKAGKVEEVASKKELEDFLKNKFMLSLMAEENAVSPDVITDKVTELLKRYPDGNISAQASANPVIPDDLVPSLEAAGYLSSFYDDNYNEVPVEQATILSVFSFTDFANDKVTIRLPKRKVITFDMVMSKLSKKSTYKNFSEAFKKVLDAKGLGTGLVVYPATYGIGIFVAVGDRGNIEGIKQEVESLMDEYGIQYATEYSDAEWVFRYRISKSSENISKLEKINQSVVSKVKASSEVKVTEDDIVSVWPAHLTYLTEIINEEYSLKEAQEDVRGLIGSEFDPRVNASKKVKAVTDYELGNSGAKFRKKQAVAVVGSIVLPDFSSTAEKMGLKNYKVGTPDGSDGVTVTKGFYTGVAEYGNWVYGVKIGDYSYIIPESCLDDRSYRR